MNIAGFNINSFVDYPGHIAAVVFTGGCDLRCAYCHNKHIFNPERYFDEEEILRLLFKHVNFLDGVVISGGEPTLQADLREFILRLKDMGYKVKLDTNGMNPAMLSNIIDITDYIAMDVKVNPYEYGRIMEDGYVLNQSCADNILESINIIKARAKDYEFRTTVLPDFTVYEIISVAKVLQGAKLYSLQSYRHFDGSNICGGVSGEFIQEAAKAAGEYVYTEIKGA